MTLPRWLAWLAPLFGLGCGANLLYKDVYTPGGNVNFHVFVPPSDGVAGIYRVGVPTSQGAWDELRTLVAPNGEHVLKVVLHDAAEGDESPATRFGWELLWIPLVPEGDRPLTVLEKPSKHDVHSAVKAILRAHALGVTVVFGCQHDRERGGLVAARLGMEMFKWSADYAFDYMVKTGSRIEVSPGLLAYWVDVTGDLEP